MPVACVLALCSGACAPRSAGDRPIGSPPAPPPVVRVVLLGDVMLGRGVAPVVAGDPRSVFEALRPVVATADLALANLESPLTDRPHVLGEHALEADPAAAALLAGAGFDVVSVANNHAMDAGPATLLDTLGALDAAGVRAVGAGPSPTAAAMPVIVDVAGVRVGIAAFDLSGGVAATAQGAGVAQWDEQAAHDAVERLRAGADVVVVGLHGGVEYLTRPDPVLTSVTDLLAGWGVDVVWGHGAHVTYPIEVHEGARRAAVVAPGLGNALFDQRLPGTQVGAVLEVLAGRDGVVALRTGRVRTQAGRAAFDGWDEPAGDAVALDGEWWSLVGAPAPAPSLGAGGSASLLPESYDETARATGDVTGAGVTDIVVAYRRTGRDEPLHRAFPGVRWEDDQGRTAHLAVFTSDGRMRWGAATLLQPVGRIAVCTGSLALGFTRLDDDAMVAGSAWTWDGFGFATSVPLPGPADPGCADVDHDGRSEPILTGRQPVPGTDE